MRKLITLFFLAFTCTLFAQVPEPAGITVGLQYVDYEKVYDGPLLFSPQGSDQVYLINTCGEVINTWTFTGDFNYTGTYLLEDGSVIKFVFSDAPGGAAAYGDGCFERRDWDDNLVWQYCAEGRYKGLHSDLVMLPNGNILGLVQDPHNATEAIQAGANPNNFGNSLSTESVIEFMPIGTNDAEVVWEWHQWDHLIQDFDASKDNYGVIADNPHRYNINLIGGGFGGANSHFNGMHYHEERDHIIVSSWKDDEIYIIDHSTTADEAAGSIGGNGGRGGDFLWRWGNPNNYDAGNNGDRRLGGQHNPKFIPDSYDVFGGMISVFNNDYGALIGQNGFSGACILELEWDDVNNEYPKNSNGQFLPEDFTWTWIGENFPGNNVSSGIMGGVDVQSNGNVVITEATSGKFTEVTPDGDIAWIYQCPIESSWYGGGSIADQGDNIQAAVYKIDKYSSSFAAFDNVDLDYTEGIIENENYVSDDCVYQTSVILPVSFFTYTIGDPGAQTIVSFDEMSENAISWAWDFGDGNTSTEWNPEHAYDEDGTYTVCLTITNPFGEDTYCEEITIMVVGIEDLIFENNILIGSESISILNPAQFDQLFIYDLQGQLLMQTSVQDETSIGHLSNGVYLLNVTSSDGELYSRKLMVQ